MGYIIKVRYFNNKLNIFGFLPVFFLFLLLLLLPSINLTAFARPTIISKTLFFSFAIIGVLNLYILSIISQKAPTLSFKISKIDISVFMLFAFILINRYLIQFTFGFSIRFIELLGLGAFYLVLRILDVKKTYFMLLAIIISGIIQAVYGNLQLLGYYASNHTDFKLTGSFFNPGPYAGFLASVFPIALGLYLFRDQIMRKVMFIGSLKTISNRFIKYIFEGIPLIGIISILLVLPATQSRASLLAVVLTSIVLIEFRYRIINRFFRQISTWKKVLLIVASVSIIVMGLAGIYRFKKGSSEGRLFIWKTASEIIKDNPLFGVGFDRFKAHYMNYQAAYFSKYGETSEALKADNTYYAFNEFIQFLVENGIIGILLLFFAMYQIFNLKVKNHVLKTILLGSLVSICVFAFFSYTLEILPIKMILTFLLGALAILEHKRINIQLNSSLYSYFKHGFKPSLFVCTLLITTVSINYFNNLNFSLKHWKLALDSYQYGNNASAIRNYENAYSELSKNGEFLMQYGKALAIDKQYEKTTQILEQAKAYLNTTIIETALGDAYKGKQQYTKAENAYQHAADMIPSRFYPLYLLAKLYDESNQNEKAIRMANTIINKDIKIPSTAILEIKAEMKALLTKNPQG